jgi:hypothetical protein
MSAETAPQPPRRRSRSSLEPSRRFSASGTKLGFNTRIVIEQAKGMVADREGLNMEQAFTLLRNHARNHNLRLADVAHDVIAGTLPAAALDRPRRTQPT